MKISSLEAFSYLFQYADSVNKPIVINYSAGFVVEYQQPDGNSLFDIAVSELLNEKPKGRMLVAAVGNFGGTDDLIHKGPHLELNLQQIDSAVLSAGDIENTFFTMSFYGEENKGAILGFNPNVTYMLFDQNIRIQLDAGFWMDMQEGLEDKVSFTFMPEVLWNLTGAPWCYWCVGTGFIFRYKFESWYDLTIFNAFDITFKFSF